MLQSNITATVLVVVNSGLRSAIQDSLVQYENDLKCIEGYDVIIVDYGPGSPSDLKTQILGYYNSLTSQHPLVGSLFVGDLPIPWFGDSTNNSPIDMYYMDLKGEWKDLDGDGIFDQLPEDIKPLIWIGRLVASPINGNEAELIKDYFAKIHQYRTGQLEILDRAIAYVDDEWKDKGDYGMSSAYTDVTLVEDIFTTNADDYTKRLDERYEFVHLVVHSSPVAHNFKQNFKPDGTVWNSSILHLNPKPVFYCFDACQSARYTENNYIGGCYIFSGGQALAVIGETRDGNSMEKPEEFYGFFGEGLSLGESFIKWLSNGLALYHLERTILGDPTLRRSSQYIPPPSGLSITATLN